MSSAREEPLSWNILRYTGEVCHEIAIVLLILQLNKSRNARGISVKTQELRLVVFVSRYAFLFTEAKWLYSTSPFETCLRFSYILTTLYTIITIRCLDPWKSVYNFRQDSFPHWKFCVAPSLVLALLTAHYMVAQITLPQLENEEYPDTTQQQQIRDYAWFLRFYYFSIFVESVAILPQLLVLRKYRFVENLTGKFILFLGLYRLLYILQWFYNIHYFELPLESYRDRIPIVVAGILQTLLFSGFIYEYLKLSPRIFGRKTKQGDDNNIGSSNANTELDSLVFELASASAISSLRSRSSEGKQIEKPLWVGAGVHQDGTTINSASSFSLHDSSPQQRIPIDP